MISSKPWGTEVFKNYIPDSIDLGYYAASYARKCDPSLKDLVLEDLDKLLSKHDYVLLLTNELLKREDMENMHFLLDDYHKRSKIVYMISSGTTETVEHYHAWCEYKGYQPIKVFVFNHCQILKQPNKILNFPERISLDNYQRSKIFNCFNYGIRLHRTQIIADIFLNNLDKLGYVTYGDSDLPAYIEAGIPNCKQRILDFYNQNKRMFPLTLDNPHDFKDRCDWTSEIWNAVNDSFLSVCVESFYYDLHNTTINDLDIGTHHNTYGGLFPYNKCITEKCFRPMATGTLGIFHTTYNTLDLLRHNYDIFDDIIDHSYDNEIDPEKRHDIFMEEFKRLAHIPHATWKQIYKENLDRRRTNFSLRLETFSAMKLNMIANVHFAQDPRDLLTLLEI